MGSSATRENLAHNHVSNEWVDMVYGDQYTVVRSKTNQNLQAQEYVYELDPKRDSKQQLKIYEERNKINGPIVKTFFNVNQQVNKYFSQQNIITVVTQRIPYRLSAIPQLSEPEAIYTLRQSLRGFNILYDKVGYFKINPDMIGFTNNGQAKVWFNRNFALNTPQLASKLYSARIKQDLFREKKDTELIQQEMLTKNIIQIVQNKCKNGQFAQPLHSNLQRQNLGFISADSQLQRYSMQNRITVPSKINLKRMNQAHKDQTANPNNNQPLFYQGVPNFIDKNYIQNKNQNQNMGTTNQYWPNVSANQHNSNVKVNQYITNTPNIQQVPTVSKITQPIASISNKPGLKFTYQQPKQYYNPSVIVQR